MVYDIFNNYMKKYLNESVENSADNNLYLAELNEAAMSAEDNHDSEILKSIIDKTEVRTNAKLTPEEKDILAKYGLDRVNRTVLIPDATGYSISDADLSNPRGGNTNERAGTRYYYNRVDPRRVYNNDPSQVNYADIARKRGARSQAKIDAILGDKINKYADERQSLKNKQRYRDYHKRYVDEADAAYQEAIKKAKDEYERAIAAAEKARDQVDEYHRPEYERYAAEIDSMLGKNPKK